VTNVKALTWFEKELVWGVAPGELSHLTGRIGELYAAMITRGQMAIETNQRGYDVVSADNERISVKTVTTSTHVNFNANTFALVDRVIILRINIDDEIGVSVETIMDETVENARTQMRGSSNKLTFGVSSGRSRMPLENLNVTDQAEYGEYMIQQYENGTIEVLKHGERQPVAKMHLRVIAAEIGIDTFYEENKEKNTRLLGAHIIKKLNAMKAGG